MVPSAPPHRLLRWEHLNADTFVVSFRLRESSQDDLDSEFPNPFLLRAVPASVARVRAKYEHREARLALAALEGSHCGLHLVSFAASYYLYELLYFGMDISPINPFQGLIGAIYDGNPL